MCINNKNMRFIEDLYKKYRNIVYIQIKSKCFSKNESDVEDCISQTFSIALENSGKLISHPNPKAFLLKTAANVTRNFNYRYNREFIKTKPVDDSTIGSVLVEEQVEDKLTEEEIVRKNIYQNIMNDLTPKQKELYFLYFIEGKSTNEIANLMGEENGTIRTRISRLRYSIINKIDNLLK